MTKNFQDKLAGTYAAVPTITPEEAMKLVNDSNVVFVDLRDGTEAQASGKVKGAVHIPRGLLEFQADLTSPSHNKIPAPENTIITYCASGGQASLSGKALKDMGFTDVRNMGAFEVWKRGGGAKQRLFQEHNFNRCGRNPPMPVLWRGDRLTDVVEAPYECLCDVRHSSQQANSHGSGNQTVFDCSCA